MNNWERMKAGRLYNADSKDLEQYHKFGMETCDKFNRTPLWRKKRKQRLLEKLIPSAKDGGAAIFAPFYCEYGVNIHFGKGCFVNYKCTFLDCAPITLEDGVPFSRMFSASVSDNWKDFSSQYPSSQIVTFNTLPVRVNTAL